MSSHEYIQLLCRFEVDLNLNSITEEKLRFSISIFKCKNE